jgi:hypothetical protein
VIEQNGIVVHGRRAVILGCSDGNGSGVHKRTSCRCRHTAHVRSSDNR